MTAERALATLILLWPLASAADVAVAPPPDPRINRCLAEVRRVLSRAYPNDDGENDYCEIYDVPQDRSANLHCGGTCDSHNCHNDACDDWSSSLYVTLTRSAGPMRSSGYDDARWSWYGRLGGLRVEVEAFAHGQGADDPRLRRRLLRQFAATKRALEQCLSPP